MSIEAATVQDTYEKMLTKLERLVPAAELRIKAELVYEINRLKKERGALILGHNYMEPALFHTVPDMVGDSLGLSREAANTDKDIIIFCGVRFMAETAKILNPGKTVLLPAKEAGCSLAASITVDDVLKLKEAFPGAPVVTYINTYADVKAVTDICCTSSNAQKVIESLDDEVILFLPDQFLARNVANECGLPITIASRNTDGDINVDKNFTKGLVGWAGTCEVHEQFTVSDIDNVRRQFPDVTVLTHPESPPEVVAASDYSNSTTKMVSYVQESPLKGPFLILTECSMGDNIIAENPDKEILRLCSVRCPHMNQITLEDTLRALTHNEQLIEVPEETRVKALSSVERMLEIS